MALNFSFATASRIIFGNNSVEKISELIPEMGKKLFLVTGKNAERATEIFRKSNPEIDYVLFQVEKEPTTDIINEGVALARSTGCDVIAGFGGGSVVDSAKAIAALVPNKGNLMDYLEVIGKGKPLTEAPLPSLAIPTTAGTGAEVTKNSVIKSPEHSVKVSLRSNLMYPDAALVDPMLMHSMPPELTAATGLDALTHLLETFVSRYSNPFIDLFCREGIKRIASALPVVYKDGNDIQGREDMAMASMLGGMALANVKLGAIHGFAGPVGGMFPIPHGEICGCLTPAVIEMNVESLKEQNGDLSKFGELARILTGNRNAMPEDAAVWAENFIRELKIPYLSAFGLTENDFPELVKKAKNASSMQGNPVQFSDEQLIWILEKSLVNTGSRR